MAFVSYKMVEALLTISLKTYPNNVLHKTTSQESESWNVKELVRVVHVNQNNCPLVVGYLEFLVSDHPCAQYYFS